jgi:hypothetical protein
VSGFSGLKRFVRVLLQGNPEASAAIAKARDATSRIHGEAVALRQALFADAQLILHGQDNGKDRYDK